MKLNGIQPNRPDLHNVAAELGIGTRDILIHEGVLTIYNTSEACQGIVNDNALVSLVAMSLNISTEDISNIIAVVEVPAKMEFNFDDDDDD